MPRSLVPARITSWQVITVQAAGSFASCVYVAVDSRRRDVADFLAGAHRCGDSVRWDWKAVAGTRRAQVGADLLHACGSPQALRLVFETARHRRALERLADTGRLVVGRERWGHPANRIASYRVDGDAVRAALKAADAALRELLAPWN